VRQWRWQCLLCPARGVADSEDAAWAGLRWHYNRTHREGGTVKLRPFRQLGAGFSHVPADELPDHLGAFTGADERAELVPQGLLDPDGAVGGVARCHATKGNRWISNTATMRFAVDIHAG